MTYLALARKWRPKNFTEVMGQSHVVKALSNALTSGRVHHAFLFTGTRGVGKTTLARIFAKSLNCEQGMSATPCGECSICVNVDQGRFIDLIEVDAASRTGIDDMRELLDNVQYAPTQGRYKVYLIDEIHMLSKSSFNALLKTLEEPPEHIKFLFATTDPQKLPVTVLSRCLQFNLKALQPDEIGQQISHILAAEDIVFDDTGVQLISRAADGSLRDGLSLLEQAISQGGGEINAESVRTMLGTVKASHIDDLLTAIIANDAEKALETINTMASYAADFNAAINQLLIELHLIALAQIAADALTYKVTDVEKYLNYAQQISTEDIQLCYQIALMAKRDIALAPDYRSGFEMAVMRVIAFKPVDAPRDNNVQGNETQDSVAVATVNANNSESIKPVEPNNSTINESITEVTVTPASSIPAVEEKNIDQKTTNEIISSNNVEASIEKQLEENIPSGNKGIHDVSKSMSNIDHIPQNRETETSVTSNVGSSSNVSFDDDSRRAPSKPQINASSNHADTDLNQAPQLPTDGFNATVTARPAPTVLEQDIPVMGQDRTVISRQEPAHQQAQAHSSVETAFSEPNLTAVSGYIDDEDDPNKGLPQASHSEWAGFVEQLQLNGLVRELAMNMACADIQTEPMRLSLDPNFQYMKNPTREEVIIDEIRKLRGTNYQINIVVESTVNETPSERIKRLSGERDQNTLQQLKDDPAVQSVMHAFDMSIDESSIKPK